MLRDFRSFSYVSIAAAAVASCGQQPCENTSSGDRGPVVRLDVSLATCNFRPKADISARNRVRKKELVRLDGSESVDPNDDPLTFRWTLLERPKQSNVELPGDTTAVTSFTPDRGGTYEVQLEVTDGELDSPPVTATIEAENTPPVAAAGEDFVSPLDMPAMLDGTASTDDDDDDLTYSWDFKLRPDGSQAQFADPTSPTPTFTPDVYGTYEVALVVNDGEVDSAEDVVRVGGGITGLPPVADAGPDVNAILGVRAPLDGSASFDPEGSALTYAWRVAEEPPRSLADAVFSDPTAAQPTFTPAKEGTYTLELVVQDEFYSSPADTVQVMTVVGTGEIGDPCEPLGCPEFSICQGGVCVPRGGCGMKTEAGGDTPETHTFELGATSGTFDFTYDTYSIKDRIEVLYEGQVIFDTGCVGKAETKTITFAGSSTEVTVQVTPNCANPNSSGTAWEFEVGCP